MPVRPIAVARRRPLIAAALAAAALAGAVVPAARAQADAPIKIGVVNVAIAFGKTKDMQEFNAYMRNRQDLLEAAEKGYQAQMNDMQQRLNNLKPDTDQYDALAKDATETLAKFKMEEQLKKAELTLLLTKHEKALFVLIQKVTTDLAKERNLDLVIVEPEVTLPATVQGVTPEQLDTVFRQKTVLFASPRIDLTADVVTRMDADYKTHGANLPPVK